MGTLGRRIENLEATLGGRAEDIKGSMRSRFHDLSDRIETMDNSEGRFTHLIEKVTAALPSSTWLALAGGSLIASLAFRAAHKQKTSMFIGDLVPTFLLLGIYNKLVKLHGSER